ncbi:MAG TPA: GNAT family N-acetyltransferase, partial [Nitrosomonas sp.]|nr:GNAT family N-acetyltransferase [Nitrosomonas sp.]
MSSSQKYLIDTNVFIGLEDARQVNAEVASFLALANKHSVGVFIHEAAKDDIARDTDVNRRGISLSKLSKFQILKKVRGLTEQQLEESYGALPKPNDIVDATLLHALDTGAIDFLISEDRGLHARARQHASHLSRRVLFIADAFALLTGTYEPVEVPIRYVDEVGANEIPLTDNIFDSLREGYDGFDEWWRTKCVNKHRRCWVVYDEGLAGLIVRKDESKEDTDATLPGKKILKVCTFKVRPEKRGIKLGELLLKQALWFAQSNKYDIVYLTTQAQQEALIDLLEYYGFCHTKTLNDKELIFEKFLSRDRVEIDDDEDLYEIAKRYYPRFYTGSRVQAYVIPIKESYHDMLFPELRNNIQGDLLTPIGHGARPTRPGNTIRKVYLCRAPANLTSPGSLLFFYKGKSDLPPSQAITTIGIFEDMQEATSLMELMQLTGGRSVYREDELKKWQATTEKPVKVINFLLAGYFSPPLVLGALKTEQIFGSRPPQSIAGLT